MNLTLEGSNLVVGLLLDGIPQGSESLDLSPLVNATPDVCAALASLPSLDIDDDVDTVIAIDKNGACVRATPEQANPLGCLRAYRDPVTYTAGPGVTPDNSATFVVDQLPTLVCVQDADTGEEEFYIIQKDVLGEWQWHHIK